MKTFDDLDFTEHPVFPDGERAKMQFDNNYGVSVVRFHGSYGYENGLYELAVLLHGDITYESGITDDVLGHLSPDGVTDVMEKVQELA